MNQFEQLSVVWSCLARDLVWRLKYSWIFSQISSEWVQPSTLDKTYLEIVDCNHTRSVWSWTSQVWIHYTSHMIMSGEIMSRNHKINHESLQFVWVNYWFNILSLAHVIQIIQSFSYQSRKWRWTHNSELKEKRKDSSKKNRAHWATQ